MKISIRDKKADLTKKYEDIYSGKKLGFNKNWFDKTNRRIPYAAVNQSFMTCTSRCKLMLLNI